MQESTALQLQNQGTPAGLQPMSVDEVIEQTQHVHELLKRVMKQDEHFGVIPGTKKPTLYQPGAEKLCVLFRVRPEFEVARNDMRDGHREYEVKCRLIHIPTGNPVGEGVGNCSTMESKYRYRKNMVVTDEPIPRDYRDRKAEYRKQGYGAKPINGEWKWVRYEEGDNPDIADTYNTVLKMARKRAFVDATKTMTAASDIFTQDTEDLVTSDGHVSGSVEPDGGQDREAEQSGGKDRQTLVNEIVAILKSECFTAEDRDDFKERLRKIRTEDLWGMKRNYQEKLEERQVAHEADQVADEHIEEEASKAADETLQGRVLEDQPQQADGEGLGEEDIF